MKSLEEIKSFLSTPKKIIITTHHKPDGDAMGSSLGLYNYLIQKKHEVQIISPTDYAFFLHWMPGNEHVLNYEEQKSKSVDLLQYADLIFCLDFNRLERINEMGKLVAESKAMKIMIDHHLAPDNFTDFKFCDEHASSTSELVYDFIILMGDEKWINADTATCLYTGIMSDTGSFRFPSTTSKVHHIVADLLDRGVKHYLVHDLVQDNFSENRLRFFGFCFKEKLQIFHEYKTALISVTAQELRQYKIGTGDTEGLVNFPLSIEGIKLAVLIIDRTKVVKLSFRSKGNFPANEIAEKYFEGGGHLNAAGGKSSMTLEETVRTFIRILPTFSEKLNEK